MTNLVLDFLNLSIFPLINVTGVVLIPLTLLIVLFIVSVFVNLIKGDFR